MKTFIKSCDLSNIKLKYKLMYISYLSVVIFYFLITKIKLYDIKYSSLLGLTTNSIFSFATIILIPGALLYYLYSKLSTKTDKELKICNIFSNLNLFMILISFILMLRLLLII
ncbi:hypothetical protein [Clostridium sp. ZS2]|uniref:hypothetical protein n=1 Tax=Clostridium sp. ZS2 TaxID=2949988 RepID=UPI00207A9474|nr:hypothetical protein [Clostridium sp. ZS2]